MCQTFHFHKRGQEFIYEAIRVSSTYLFLSIPAEITVKSSSGHPALLFKAGSRTTWFLMLLLSCRYLLPWRPCSQLTCLQGVRCIL